MNTAKSFSRITSIAFLVFCGGAAGISAQVPVPSSTPACPTVSVSSPDSVKAGEDLTMTVNISGGDPNVTPSYNWTVSASQIDSGQGTSSITIGTKGLKGDSALTASVDVAGYMPSCSTYQSSTTMIMANAEARKIDEFGKIRTADQSARLDNFALELKNDQTAKGYIIVYAGRTGAKGATQKTGNTAKAFLVSKRKLNAAQVVTIDGGYREEQTTELWLVPEGADVPTISPTLDPSEVEPAKKTSAKKVKIKKA